MEKKEICLQTDIGGDIVATQGARVPGLRKI